jgi:hypothetical protein
MSRLSITLALRKLRDGLVGSDYEHLNQRVSVHRSSGTFYQRVFCQHASPTMSRLSISSALRKLLADSSGPAVTGNEHLSQQSKTLLIRRVPLCTFPIARRGFQRRLVGEADQILGFVHAFACRNRNRQKRYEKTFR